MRGSVKNPTKGDFFAFFISYCLWLDKNKMAFALSYKRLAFEASYRADSSPLNMETRDNSVLKECAQKFRMQEKEA